MNAAIANRITEQHAWKPFGFGLLFCLLQAGNLLATDPGALKLEEAQRAFQARYEMLTGQTATWPTNAWGQVPSEYPPDGFYEDDLVNEVAATALVKDLAGKIKDADFGHHFTTATDGDIDGLDTIPLIEPLLPYGNCGAPPPYDHTIPWPEDIGVTNYPSQFQKLVEVLCKAKYMVWTYPSDPVGEHVLSHNLGTSDSYCRKYFQWLVSGEDLFAPDTFEFDLPDADFEYDLTRLELSVNHAFVYTEVTLAGVTLVNGDSGPLPTDQMWIGAGSSTEKGVYGPVTYDDTGFIIPGTGCYPRTCEEQFQIALTNVVNDSSGNIGASQYYSRVDGLARLSAAKGRVTADLTPVNGKARAYVLVQGDASLYQTPFPGDGQWHFLEEAQTGSPWESTTILGDDVLTDTDSCWMGDYFQVGWNLNEVVIVTPDFQYNIADCECPTCSGQNCRSGDVVGSLGDDGPKMTIGLGLTDYGQSAGQLVVGGRRSEGALAQPSNLEYHTSPDSEVVRTTDGVVRQVKTAQTLVDIVTISGSKYEIRLYTSANAGTKSGGVYQPSPGSEFSTVAVENPSGNTNELQVTEVTDGATRVSALGWNDSNGTKTWTLVSGGGLRQEERTSQWGEQHQNRTEIYTVSDGDQHIVYKERLIYQLFDWGEELVQKVVDPDGAALTTTWQYDNNRYNSYGYTRLSKEIAPSGHWTWYLKYDQFGNPVTVASQFKDLPVSTGSNPNPTRNSNRVTTTTFGATDPPTVTVVEYIGGHEVSRWYTLSHPGETREIQAQAPGAALNDSGNLVTVTRTYVGGPFEGQIQSITRPDGTMSVCQYFTSSNTKTTVILNGAPDVSGANVVDGTKKISVVDIAGNTVSDTTYDIVSGLMLTSATTTEADDFGRPTRVEYNDGTFETTVYGCCGIESQTDREGITTTYTYDALKRMSSMTRAGITTLYTYDANGRPLTTTRQGTDNSQITQNASSYDMAGRLIASTNALGYVTTYGEVIDGSGHTVKTTTLPDGSRRIETYYQDGQLLSVTGTAVHGVRYDYALQIPPDESVYRVYSREIRLNTDLSDSAEETKTYTDMLGRAYRTRFGDGTGTTTYFNNNGQIVKQVDPDGVTTLFGYNGRGELETTAIDVDRNGQIDFDGTDRITKAQSSVLTAHGTTVRRTTTTIWTADNADVAETVSVNDVSADGLQSWSISYGPTNHVQTVYNGNGQRTVTTTNPDGSYSVTTYQDGRLMTNTAYDALGSQLSAVSYQYDAHGRQSNATDARTGATIYSYDNGDYLTSVSANGQTTSYGYDNRDRQVSITLPDSGVVTNVYWSTGELAATWGARTYPVAYAYDYAGRLQTNTTWQNFAVPSGAATTTWNYDSQRGFLTSKTYNDGTGPSYAYTSAGRLGTRQWARGVTTTYGYNNAGDLGWITYSDDTPAVALGYDRRGRRISVTSGTDVCAYSYNDAGQLLTESFPNSGVIVTNSYDSLLRRSSLSSSTGVSPVSYSYDNASRLSSISDGTHSATYSYLLDSSLVSNIVFATSGAIKMTTTKNYDNLNRLSSITSSAGVSPVSSHSYQYDTANQRTRVDIADPAGGGASGSYWLYEYDALGQVTSGKKYWSDGTEVAGQQFGYSFDSIGNRTANNANGHESDYSANALNQYTQRAVPGFVDILGTADSNATVTVNNQATTRKGEYFHKALAVANSAAAVYTNIWIVGVRKNAGANSNDVVTQVTGHEFLPQSPEVFGYDSDGNLTNDGRWVYTWDGENRLISMETDTNKVGAASVPRQKLLFGYDYRGRRISKVVSNFDGSVWSLTSDLRFVYDGWNMVAEVGTSGSLVRSYTWGLDSSGTEQGAGGIGGLLAVASHQSPITTHFVSYDGNGNVVALLDAQSAKPSARYEYGPFGETLRATGSAAGINPFRFSNKYADVETALLYYGHRYYSPSAGKWLSRDPIGEQGGEDLYAFVVNCPEKWVDPAGLLLAAVDGTGSRTWLTRNRDARRWNSHVRNFFTDYMAPGPKHYWHGPDNETTGSDSPSIHKEVIKWICSVLTEKPNEPINLIGHSRGGYIVMQVAVELGKKGCPCDKDKKGETRKKNIPSPIRVNFLGLYDPVDMVAGYGEGESVPSNVDNGANAMGDPKVHSRPYFNRADHGAENTSITDYSERLFDATHGGMGGDPWGGDHPRGMTEERDRAGSAAVDIWMRQRARAAGISLAN